MAACLQAAAWFQAAAFAQANRGELRLAVVDPAGAGLQAKIELDSRASHFHRSVETDATGHLTFAALPFGLYQATVARPGFAVFHVALDVHSSIPELRTVQLGVAGVTSEIKVNGQNTLVDLDSASVPSQIGPEQIGERLSSLPGRSVQDLVVSQPGWLYEGNAVLHPRGSEYDTQFVIDGIPLMDNRSPSFGPEIEADDLESMSIYTAGFPAEYGRKMGGVVELNTRRQTDPGLHGEIVASGGSYDTMAGFGRLQETRKKDSLSASASGSRTDHYLNPVVPQNYTNSGTTGDFAAVYERDLDSSDRLTAEFRHELSHFLIPNEFLQQQAGQRQDGANAETLGTARYQRILSPDSLLVLSGMVRRTSRDLNSNTHPTPIAAFLHNHFTEGYFKGTWSLHRGRHEWKAGVESDAAFLHENFRYLLTDPTRFDPGTRPSLSFTDARPDLEQSAFVEDAVRLREWTFSLGVRWDHYQLLLNRQAVSPRLAVGRAFKGQDLVLHAAYDRVFQTPSFDNILLSSSAQVDSVNRDFLRLPVQPSSGDDFELGATKGLANRVRIDGTIYRRMARNAADDDQLLNTGLSYPIAFNKSVVYGAEGKLQLANIGPVTGFVSYSYMVSTEWFPVTGGLFLGSDAQSAASELSGHFPATQDQRNTLATRWETRLSGRLRVGGGAGYGSGLPFDYGGTEAEALAQYGPAVVSRLNFERGRVRPNLAVSASLSADVFRHDRVLSTLHVDAENLNGRLNVLDFGGLFSGNAIAPGRSVMLRWERRF
ncbi:TonB-dependent receptor [Acidobacteria bacterium AB60]|nr:TonB-dependent receptor [Acidobacteria bacterium AB60]